MILVRDVFHLKFGKARDFKAAMQEGLTLLKGMTPSTSWRLLSDLTGRSYTFVLESTYDDLQHYKTTMDLTPEQREVWSTWYVTKVVPLCESGERQIYTIEG
jgi:hypothetical protein